MPEGEDVQRVEKVGGYEAQADAADLVRHLGKGPEMLREFGVHCFNLLRELKHAFAM